MVLNVEGCARFEVLARETSSLFLTNSIHPSIDQHVNIERTNFRQCLRIKETHSLGKEDGTETKGWGGKDEREGNEDGKGKSCSEVSRRNPSTRPSFSAWGWALRPRDVQWILILPPDWKKGGEKAQDEMISPTRRERWKQAVLDWLSQSILDSCLIISDIWFNFANLIISQLNFSLKQ